MVSWDVIPGATTYNMVEKLITQVKESAQGTKKVTIPKSSSIQAGDHILITKIDLNKLNLEEKHD